MKTAKNKHVIMGAWLLALSLSINPVSVWAADAAAPSTPPVIPAPPSSSATASAPDVKVPDLSVPLPADKKGTKNAETPGDKIPDSVKEVIKHLDNKVGDITLDDLNAAREAVAKLDALIDIEKRLADLEKIRQEREGGNKSLAMTIPPNLLNNQFQIPPPRPPMEREPVPSLPSQSQPAFSPPQAPVDVVRIEGSNNHYTAFLKEGDSIRSVHAGDHLDDNSVVLSITTQGVELERNSTTRLVRIKGVQTVFGDSP